MSDLMRVARYLDYRENCPSPGEVRKLHCKNNSKSRNHETL